VFARNIAGAFGRAFLVGAIILWMGAFPALLVTRAAAGGSGPVPDKKPPAAMG